MDSYSRAAKRPVCCFIAKQSEETKMKTFAIIAASLFIATGAMAADSCKVQATGKHLHGAALTSFAKKCCSDQAGAQHLHGAAKTSFTKKCVSDSTGA
jgi:hypothetical protein